LRIKIDEQDALSLFRQRRAEVHCRRGFADPALLIRDRGDFHFWRTQAPSRAGDGTPAIAKFFFMRRFIQKFFRRGAETPSRTGNCTRGRMRSLESAIAIIFIAGPLMYVTRRCDGHRLRATKDRRARVAFL